MAKGAPLLFEAGLPSSLSHTDFINEISYLDWHAHCI